MWKPGALVEIKYMPVSWPKWLRPGSDNDVGPRPHGDERRRSHSAHRQKAVESINGNAAH